MKALIKGNVYNKGMKQYANQWVDIDTKYLFEDQYNTTEEYGNCRIFDRDIQKIEDDARIGYGKCKYCGAIVKRGEEEKHFVEQEAKKAACDMNDANLKTCFWKQRKYLKEVSKNTETRKEIVDGVVTTIEVTTKEEKWHPYCNYNENGTERCDCTYDACRNYGIEWFTEENCFFLKYPNGVEDFTIQTTLEYSWDKCWGDSTTHFINISYSKMLGSYTLELYLKADCKTIDHITLSNARNHFMFTYENDKDVYIVNDGFDNSPRVYKNLLPMGSNYPKVNATVNKAVRMACKDLYKYQKGE